jgi:hypothetical protein
MLVSLMQILTVTMRRVSLKKGGVEEEEEGDNNMDCKDINDKINADSIIDSSKIDRETSKINNDKIPSDEKKNDSIYSTDISEVSLSILLLSMIESILSAFILPPSLLISLQNI